MEKTFELAGWCAATAIQNLFQHLTASEPIEGPGFQPFLLIDNGKKQAHTIFAEASPQTFQNVEELMDKLTGSGQRAILAKDAFVTIEGRRLDSIILEGYLLTEPRKFFRMAVAYEHNGSGPSLVIHKPQLLTEDGFDSDSLDVGKAFFRGRDNHAEGAAIWNSHLKPRG